MKRQLLFLIFILLLAAFLRFYQLGVNPPSLTWDEAAWGYNAYSLGIDGRDEFGKFLPIQYLESFGDFKPPLYAYLDILPIKIFGLNEFAVRFPSALFGVLTVLVTYFLVRRLFHPRGEPQAQHHLGGVETLALMASFFLAISPWHINLSRAAFEANVATFFLVLGVFSFLKGLSRGVASFPPGRWNTIDTSGFWLSLSAVSFVFSMYTFNTARVVAPLLVLLLTVGFRRQLWKIKRETTIAVLVSTILISPLLQFLLTPQAQLRFQEVNIFSDLGIIERTNQEMVNDGNAWWSRVLHNRRLAYGIEYFKHYFDHFNPGFLFVKGDGNPKFSTQDVGQLYLWDSPFLVAGILFLLRKREGFWWILPLWLLVGIIPAGTARETPHTLRIETTLPTFQILVAYGFYQFISKIRNQELRIRRMTLVACCLLLVTNFIYYYHGYYAHYPYEYPGEWQHGYKEAISYVKNVESEYDTIVFTEALGRPYIYVLFYLKYDPRQFRKEADVFREVYGFVHIKGFGKFRFAKDPSAYQNQGGRLLFIEVPDRVPSGAEIKKTISLPNGNKVFVVYLL